MRACMCVCARSPILLHRSETSLTVDKLKIHKKGKNEKRTSDSNERDGRGAFLSILTGRTM